MVGVHYELQIQKHYNGGKKPASIKSLLTKAIFMQKVVVAFGWKLVLAKNVGNYKPLKILKIEQTH